LKLKYDELLSDFAFGVNLRRYMVDSCAWSPDGTRLASTSDDGTVRPTICI
jgi:WD40 repeat protein